jgi:hypothetical protein
MCSKKYNRESRYEINRDANYNSTEASSYQQLYKQAKRRVNARIGFYSHLFSYIGVNILLVTIYLLTMGGGYPWFIWPALGWGVGVVIHFVQISGFGQTQEQNWRQQVEQEMYRMGYNPYNSATIPLSSSSPWPSAKPDTRSEETVFGSTVNR